MIAKLIVKGKNRKQCIDLMIQSLNSYYIRGFNNNIKFLISVFKSKKFYEGDIHTGLLDQEYEDGYSYPNPSDEILKKIFIPVASYTGYMSLKKELHDHFDDKVNLIYFLTINKKKYPIKIKDEKNSIKILYKNSLFILKSSWNLYDGLIEVQINKKKYLLQFDKFRNHFSISYLDYSIDFDFSDETTAKFAKHMLEEEKADLSKYLLAPMPGKIISVNVKEGQKIKTGENLLVLEAMKMENLITADKDVKIKKINIKNNDAVEVDQILIEFDD